MNRTTFGLVAVLGVVVAGCGGEDTAEPEPTPEETAQAQQAATAATSTAQTLLLADALFNFDPDLDPGKTGDDNLTAIKENVAGSDQGCATWTASQGNGLTIDFGQGCTIGGVTASGSVSLKLTSTGGDLGGGGTPGLTLDLGFTDLVVNGWDIDGTATFATSNGSTFAVVLDLTHSGVTTTADVEVVGAPGSMTIDGTAGLSSSSGTQSITMTGVVMSPGGCWPSAGSVSSGGLSLVFDGQTPTTGQATLVIGKISVCQVLPNHGACVATACPTGG